MKKEEVQVGAVYLVKVSNQLVPVRIDRVHPYKGWFGTNLKTNRVIHIKSAGRLREKIDQSSHVTNKTAEEGPNEVPS
jgi:hypothetical protein